MSDHSKIEWTDATWNPVRGCSRVSEGCRRCYAERMAGRFSGPGLWAEGIVNDTPAGPRWNGNVYLVLDKLDQPLRWTRPRRVFVNSMSDLFHENLDDRAIAAVFGVMAAAPQHTFQVLTKRPERMRDWFRWVGEMLVPSSGVASGPRLGASWSAWCAGVQLPGFPDIPGWEVAGMGQWPLPNVWLGVSVEDQATANERIPLLLDTPAAVRFVSAEPLLGPVDLEPFLQFPPFHDNYKMTMGTDEWRGLDWVIVGGESGPGARPMHPDWARSLRDQCAAADVAFFMKQWGRWAPWDDDNWSLPAGCDDVVADESAYRLGGVSFLGVGKRAAGRLLDGREHNAFPGGVEQ